MQQSPAPEHQWLKQLLGEWTFETVANMGPDQPPAHFKGRETVSSFGDLWVVLDGESEMPPKDSGEVDVGRMRMTLGYDPLQKKYVGTWIGTMMTHMWIYDCSMDESEQVLTLAARGPAMTGEGMADYKDVITIVGPSERTLTSYMQMPDGSWMHFMTATYRKQ